MFSVSDLYRVKLDEEQELPVVETEPPIPPLVYDDDDDLDLLTFSEDNEVVVTETMPTSFTCPECQRVCSSKLGLVSHLRVHNKKPKRSLYTFECKECSATFETEREMDKHIRKTHPVKPSKYICSTCKLGCETIGEFYKHIESAHPPKPLLEVRYKKLKNAECL
jgi:transposase